MSTIPQQVLLEARKLARQIGVCLSEYDIRPVDRDYAYIATGRSNYSFQLMRKHAPQAVELIPFSNVRHFTEEAFQLRKLAYYMRRPQYDQYHNVIPTDLMVLSSLPADHNPALFNHLCSLEWWKDKTYHYLWVSLGTVNPELWELGLSNPKDVIAVEFGAPLQYEYVSESLHRYETVDGYVQFYHA